jgi:hypothetical protein
MGFTVTKLIVRVCPEDVRKYAQLAPGARAGWINRVAKTQFTSFFLYILITIMVNFALVLHSSMVNKKNKYFAWL